MLKYSSPGPAAVSPASPWPRSWGSALQLPWEILQHSAISEPLPSTCVPCGDFTVTCLVGDGDPRKKDRSQREKDSDSLSARNVKQKVEGSLDLGSLASPVSSTRPLDGSSFQATGLHRTPGAGLCILSPTASNCARDPAIQDPPTPWCHPRSDSPLLETVSPSSVSLPP